MLKNIFAAFAKTKVNATSTSLAEQLAKFDPEGMSEAGMMLMEQQLDDFCQKTEQARQEYTKELNEYNNIQTLYDTRITAAESISAQLEQAKLANDQALELKLTSSLNKLLDTIEQLAPDVAREKQEADEAHQTLVELEGISSELAQQMKTAKSQFESARRELASANAQKLRAELQVERANAIQGINKSGNKINVALSAIQANANNARIEAQTIKRKAELLAPTKVEQDDDVIASAMKQAQGKPVTETIEQRMARLKAK